MTQANDADPGVVDFEPESRDLVAELFPVEVALPDGRVIPRGKVFVLVGGVVVFGEDGRTPVRVFASRHSAPAEIANLAAPKRRQHTVVHTAEGDIHVNGILGCGCASPLKGFTLAQALAK